VSVDTTFARLGVPTTLVDLLAERGITTPTPIQAATLPDSLAGRDVLGRGRTGSGKTYAFLLPLLTRLAASGTARRPGRPRALVLAPTRELVLQIEAAMAPMADALGLRSQTVFGGVGQNPQVRGLKAGVDVVLACPGRLEDLIGQGHVSLDAVEVTVLDEADHMADLGFLPAVRRLLDATPAGGQRLLFSATLDSGVNVLVKRYLSSPVTHEADSAQSPVAQMTHHVFHLRPDAHFPVLLDLAAAPGRTVVFTRTKHRAKKLARQLNSSGVPAVELHGNLGQNARTRNLEAFHDGSATTLVATDIAARGIHVDDVGLVIHADPPVEHKAYLHRSGRTARAGSSGTVVTLMTDEQVRDVRDLTRKAGINPTTTRVHLGHPLLAEVAQGERTFAGAFQPAGGSSSGAGSQGGGSSQPGTGSRRPGRGRGRGGAADGSASGGGSGRPGSGRTGSGRSGSAAGGSGRGGAGRPGGKAESGAGARGAGDARGRAGARRGGSQGSGTGRTSSGRSAGSTTAYSTSTPGSGGAAAFSAGSRAGSRRGR
jgi:superfamily II DNA/RNA helicase